MRTNDPTRRRDDSAQGPDAGQNVRDGSTRRRYLGAVGGAALTALAGCLGGEGDDGMDDGDDDMEDGDDGMDDDGGMKTAFDVVVENVSSGDTLQTMDGSVAVPLSPLAYAVHTGMGHLFTPEEAASDALEALAEDGMPGDLAEKAGMQDDVVDSGTVATPEGADEPGPLGPGETYEFSVEVAADDDPALSLATMFVQSNDLFYAPGPDGIPLYEDGEPVEGDVTDALALWDAGTEKNQPPGEGDDQAPRQDGPDTGTDEMGEVRRIDAVDDGYEYPAVEDVISVTVTTM